MNFRKRPDSNIERLPFSGCHIWMGTLTLDGYGMYNRRERAHRKAWEQKHGEIPKKLYVLHSCDIRCCVNPAHLRLGTQQDNMDDMVARNRQPFNSRGVANPKAKLTEKQVSYIKALKTGTKAPLVIGRKFGVSASTIEGIWAGRFWKDIKPASQEEADSALGELAGS